MSVEMALPIDFSDSAAKKVKELVTEEENPNLKLRVYVTGGGCSGFQYGFTFDEKVNEGDMTIEKDSVTLGIAKRRSVTLGIAKKNQRNAGYC